MHGATNRFKMANRFRHLIHIRIRRGQTIVDHQEVEHAKNEQQNHPALEAFEALGLSHHEIPFSSRVDNKRTRSFSMNAEDTGGFSKKEYQS